MEFKNLKKWQCGECYIGKNMSEYWVVASKTRDSKIKEEYVFKVICEWLNNHSEIPYEIHRFNHFACGWYENVLIHQSVSEENLKIVDELIDFDNIDSVLLEYGWEDYLEEKRAEVLEGQYLSDILRVIVKSVDFGELESFVECVDIGKYKHIAEDINSYINWEPDSDEISYVNLEGYAKDYINENFEDFVGCVLEPEFKKEISEIRNTTKIEFGNLDSIKIIRNGTKLVRDWEEFNERLGEDGPEVFLY